MAFSEPTSALQAVRGAWLNPVSDTRCDYFADGLLVVRCEAGSWKVVELGPFHELIEKYPLPPGSIQEEPGLLMPPFFDMHFHWVQDEVREMPKTSLLEWLETYTFPKEAEFADAGLAEEKARVFWNRILSTGTIGGLCYSSIHKVALAAAMRHAPEHFKIGNVLMTMHSPDNLTQTVADAVSLNNWAAETYGQRHIGSPRFAPATGPVVLTAAADTAGRTGGFLQTHLSESLEEIAWVRSIYRKLPGFETVQSYTEIYERTGILGPKTVLGHCIHLTDAEWKLLAGTNSIVASCPTSNDSLRERGLGSGLFDFRRAEREGVRWVLGSDIGGGPYLSMLDVMTSFVRQNRSRGIESATWVKALFRSTQAGAEVLGLGDRKGTFGKGKDLDYIAVNVAPAELCAHSAESVLDKALAPLYSKREHYEMMIHKTVIEGTAVFTC